jgi:hypothetical protein
VLRLKLLLEDRRRGARGEPHGSGVDHLPQIFFVQLANLIPKQLAVLVADRFSVAAQLDDVGGSGTSSTKRQRNRDADNQAKQRPLPRVSHGGIIDREITAIDIHQTSPRS